MMCKKQIFVRIRFPQIVNSKNSWTGTVPSRVWSENLCLSRWLLYQLSYQPYDSTQISCMPITVIRPKDGIPASLFYNYKHNKQENKNCINLAGGESGNKKDKGHLEFFPAAWCFLIISYGHFVNHIWHVGCKNSLTLFYNIGNDKWYSKIRISNFKSQRIVKKVTLARAREHLKRNISYTHYTHSLRTLNTMWFSKC